MQLRTQNSKLLLDGFEAVGTKIWIEIFDKEVLFGELAKRLETEIRQFENSYSRFKSSNILSDLNERRTLYKNEYPDLVYHHLVVMLKAGLQTAEKTKGIFDLFIKERLEAIGYGVGSCSTKKTGIPSDGAEQSTVIFSEDKIELVGNKSIDLGGVGKGYLISLLSESLQQEGMRYFLINAGGDMYMTSDNDEPIELLLEHPTNPDEYIYKIKIKDSALCVSSSFKRMWMKNGQEINHFITPDDTHPWAIAYIVGADVVLADMAATVACIVAGGEDVLREVMSSLGEEYLVINARGDTIKSDNFPTLLP